MNRPQLLARAGITQKETAIRADVDQASVSRWVNYGPCSPSMGEQIERVLREEIKKQAQVEEKVAAGALSLAASKSVG